jgi:glycerol-3-phosphate acyltransferase PlsY
MPPSENWGALFPLALGLCFASFVIGYLLGSIPFGLIFTKLAGRGDVRQIGSGNIGATNVLRTGSKGLAALTLLFDVLKGTAAVWIGWHFGSYAAMAGGLGAFLGHLFPVWLSFHGGKGVATYIGVVASAATVGGLVFTGNMPFAGLFLLLTVLLYVRHAGNIQRLMKGEETRIGESKQGAD